jgi:hypothetical protein
MTNPIAKLAALRGSLGDATHVETKADVDALAQQRQDYRLFIEDRTATEGWSQADIDEFAALVKTAMQTKEGADAAADFLADQARIIREMRAAFHERFLLCEKRLSQPLPPCQSIFLPEQ